MSPVTGREGAGGVRELLTSVEYLMEEHGTRVIDIEDLRAVAREQVALDREEQVRRITNLLGSWPGVGPVEMVPMTGGSSDGYIEHRERIAEGILDALDPIR